MGAKTDHFEGIALKAFFGDGKVVQAPGNWYVALFTAAPGETGGGTEVAGGSYARVLVANTSANWDLTNGGAADANVDGVADNATVNNAAQIDFPAPTANWGQATHWGLFDAATGGNLWIYAVLTTPKTINNGDPAPNFPIGSLTYQEDN